MLCCSTLTGNNIKLKCLCIITRASPEEGTRPSRHYSPNSQAAATQVPESIERVVQRFAGVQDPKIKVSMLLSAGKELPLFPEAGKIAVNRVMGCTAQVRVPTA